MIQIVIQSEACMTHGVPAVVFDNAEVASIFLRVLSGDLVSSLFVQAVGLLLDPHAVEQATKIINACLGTPV